MDALLTRAAYRRHPKPKVADIIGHGLRERGDEVKLFSELR